MMLYFEDDNTPIRCPHCGSVQLTLRKRGFNVKRAMWGSLWFGENGFLSGFFGSNNDVIECERCGYSWEPE